MKMLSIQKELLRIVMADCHLGFWIAEMSAPLPLQSSTTEQIMRLESELALVQCNSVYLENYGISSTMELRGQFPHVFASANRLERLKTIQLFVEQQYQCREIESSAFDETKGYRFFLNTLAGIIENNALTGAIGVRWIALLGGDINSRNKFLNRRCLKGRMRYCG